MNAQTQRLIQEHIPYAKALAAKVRRRAGLPRRVEMQELEGWALLGLTEAAQRFDASRGIPFGAYAQRRIVGAVLNGIGKMHQATESVRQKARRLARLQDTLPEVDGPAVEAQDAASQLIRSIDRAGSSVLMQRWGDAAEAVCLDDPAEDVAHEESLDRLRGAIAELDEQTRRVVTLYYFEDKSMAEVGQALDISAPTVCRRHREALQKLAFAIQGEAVVESAEA